MTESAASLTTPALPTQPYTLPVEGDLMDEVGFRRFLAEHVKAQTLAAQRTEWYARSVRLMVLVWFVLFLISLVVAFIWGIVIATSEPEPDPFGGF